MKTLRVLSLFDGISCGQIALERAGIPVEVYYASEIDKYAIQVTMKNYPNTIQLGDVRKIDFTEFIGKVDLIMGGSPCQDLSIAGKRAGLQGEKSGLFYKFVEAIEVIKPKYFLLENNYGMPQDAYEEMSRLMGCYPIMINSALVSAQTRKRYYWFNWGLMQYNLFGFPTCDIPQPKNKGILLKDILENGYAPDNKSRCIQSSIGRTTEREYFKKNQGQMVGEPIIYQLPRGYNDGGIKKDKSPALTTSQWQYNNLLVNKGPVRLSQYEKSKGQAQRVYSVNAKTVTINANGGGQGGKTGLYKIDLPNGDYVIRKLTPIECERLQTLPDNYTEGISNSQRYKCLGNGWTVDVIAHIFNFLKEELESEEQ